NRPVPPRLRPQGGRRPPPAAAGSFCLLLLWALPPRTPSAHSQGPWEGGPPTPLLLRTTTPFKGSLSQFDANYYAYFSSWGGARALAKRTACMGRVARAIRSGRRIWGP